MTYEYLYQPGNIGEKTFILLHGTGGTERDLIPVAQAINPDHNILSIRGDVSEHGMARYFKRLAEGQYDVADLAKRGEALQQFLKNVSQAHGFKLSDSLFLGFSNGANMAIHLLLKGDIAYKQSILFHPMYPIPVDTHVDLSELKVFTALGRADPIVSVSESQRVVDLFETRQATVSTIWTEGHQLTYEEINSAKNWLEKNK